MHVQAAELVETAIGNVALVALILDDLAVDGLIHPQELSE